MTGPNRLDETTEQEEGGRVEREFLSMLMDYYGRDACTATIVQVSPGYVVLECKPEGGGMLRSEPFKAPYFGMEVP